MGNPIHEKIYDLETAALAEITSFLREMISDMGFQVEDEFSGRSGVLKNIFRVVRGDVELFVAKRHSGHIRVMRIDDYGTTGRDSLVSTAINPNMEHLLKQWDGTNRGFTREFRDLDYRKKTISDDLKSTIEEMLG